MAEAKKNVYLVGTTPILHDGERYEPGAAIELTDKEADRLGAHVTAVPAVKPAKAAKD